MLRSGLALLSTMLALPSVALAHAALTSPTPRNPSADIKVGPCGPFAPGTGVRTQLTAGQTLPIEFIETVNHPGYFQVWFSDVADNNYVLIQDQIPHNDLPPMPTRANPRRYTASITVPSTPCASCSLQFIQVMTDRNPPTRYFSCADISIVAPAPPDAGVHPDAQVPDTGLADAGFAPDAMAVGMDALAPSEDAATVADDAVAPAEDAATASQPDAAPVGSPDAAVALGPDAAPIASAPDGGPSSGGSFVREDVSGGCSVVGRDQAATFVLAALGLAIAGARRRRR